MAWGTVESNRFGTHEFLQYAEMLGTEPYICANLGTGTWTEAQQWVEYCNSAEDTDMTRLRKQNGRAEPWKVKYWGLGNEMDGPWQMGHRSAEDYGKFALEAAKLMKWTDPNIKLIAAGSSNYGPGSDWTGWNRTVLEYLKQHADYLSLHLYVGNRGERFRRLHGQFRGTGPAHQDRRRHHRCGALRASPRNRKIYIAWDEWNVWYRARGDAERGRRILEEHYNLEDALVVATFLNSFVNHAHIVKIANMAQLVNVIAPIFTNDKGMFLQTIYYPLQLFANNSKGKALELFVDSPEVQEPRGSTRCLISTLRRRYDNGSLVMNVVNRHPDQAIEPDFELEDKQFSGAVAVSEVNGPDIKAENDFDKTTVKTGGAVGDRQGKRLTLHASRRTRSRC